MSAGHYAERFRPQYHFSMKKCWINDPNGLIHDDVESTARVCPKALTGESTGGLLSSENTKFRRPS